MATPWPLDIIGSLDERLFDEIFAANPRPIREALLTRYGLKTKSLRTAGRPSPADRTAQLRARLVSGGGAAETSLADELLRNWLFTRRPMLGDTLDHFGVKHTAGITNDDIGFFESLEEAKVRELCDKLVPRHGKRAVEVYLRYLKVPRAAEILATYPDAQ